MKEKTPDQSLVEMRELIMPHQSNPNYTVFGGEVISWIDKATAMVAQRHSNCLVVTVHIDAFSFKAPIRIGEHAIIKAKIHYAGTTSMIVRGSVFGENPLSNHYYDVASTYVTFVALNNEKRPCTIPKLKPVTSKEQQDFEIARKFSLLCKKSKVN